MAGPSPPARARDGRRTLPPARRPIGATSSSARLCSIARITAAATSWGDLVPTPSGSVTPVLAYIPATRMKPGATTETPTPGLPQVLSEPEREPAQAELGGRVDRRRRRRGLARERRGTRGGRARAPPSPGASSRARTIGARRLMSSIRSMSSGRQVGQQAAGGQGRVGDQHIHVRRHRLGGQAVDLGADRQIAHGRPGTEVGGEPPQLRFTAAGDDQLNAPRRQRAGDCVADPASGARHQRGAAGQPEPF